MNDKIKKIVNSIFTENFKKRFIAMLWGLIDLIGLVVIKFLIDNMAGVEVIPAWSIPIILPMLEQASKHLNKKVKANKQIVLPKVNE